MSKGYRTFEEWYETYLDILEYDDGMRDAYNAGAASRSADLSAILGEFEALAGKWKEAPDEETYYQHQEIYRALSECADELSALIQSVKERM